MSEVIKTRWQDDLLKPTLGNLQLWLVVVMLMAANLSIAVSQLALGMALLVQLYRRFVRHEPLCATGLGWWTLILTAWALVMIPFSSDSGQSLIYFKRFYLFTAIWVAGSCALDRRRQWILFVAILLGAVAATTWGQIHFLQTTGSLFKHRLGEMSNPMTSGCLMMMSLLLGLGFVLGKGKLKRRLVWPGILCLPLVLALVQTMTRSAWLGFLVGVAVLLLAARPRLFGLFTALLVAVMILIPQLPDGPKTEKMKRRLDVKYLVQGNSTAQRVYMWNEGWEMFKRHPITGVGDRDLTQVGPEYYQHPDMRYYGHLHSNPVMLAAIWGAPGLVLGMGFLFLQLGLLVKRWRTLRLDPGSPAAAWTLGALGVWAGFFVAGLTEWYFGDAESMLLYLAIMGVALGLPMNSVSPGPKEV